MTDQLKPAERLALEALEEPTSLIDLRNSMADSLGIKLNSEHVSQLLRHLIHEHRATFEDPHGYGSRVFKRTAAGTSALNAGPASVSQDFGGA